MLLFYVHACIGHLLLRTRLRHAQRAGARAGHNLHRCHGHMGARGGIFGWLQVHLQCAALPPLTSTALIPTPAAGRLESLCSHVLKLPSGALSQSRGSSS
eukprot:scaffold41021_cov69-Phaeocystis_antarctica.AAC.2